MRNINLSCRYIEYPAAPAQRGPVGQGAGQGVEEDGGERTGPGDPSERGLLAVRGNLLGQPGEQALDRGEERDGDTQVSQRATAPM